MGDLLEDDLEFRGGTLQLSTETVETAENTRNAASESYTRVRGLNTNPSVLSGDNSLSPSPTSFADARTTIDAAENDEQGQGSSVVYPRYELPFDSENVKDFFTYRKGVVESAIQECITVLLFPEDGEYLGSWLLTEITLWDNERERIVLLTSRLLMTVKYDFIAMRQLDCRKTYLEDLDAVEVGELVYPPSSLVPRLNGLAAGVATAVRGCVLQRGRGAADAPPTHKLFDYKYFQPRERNIRGVRARWDRGEPLPAATAWNPFSQDVPFLTFASHPIFWHKDGATLEERATFDMEVFAAKLQAAVRALPAGTCRVTHAPVLIPTYVGVAALLHNKTSMGFFKVRGKFSF